MSGNSERPKKGKITCSRCNRELKPDEVLSHRCIESEVMQYQLEKRIAERILQNIRAALSLRTPRDRKLAGLFNERE